MVFENLYLLISSNGSSSSTPEINIPLSFRSKYNSIKLKYCSIQARNKVNSIHTAMQFKAFINSLPEVTNNIDAGVATISGFSVGTSLVQPVKTQEFGLIGTPTGAKFEGSIILTSDFNLRLIPLNNTSFSAGNAFFIDITIGYDV